MLLRRFSGGPLNVGTSGYVHRGMDGIRDAEFSAYVEARGRAWERYAYALTGDAHRAQDLVQTVLLRAYRRWTHISGVEQPDAYVRRMLTNGYLDWCRWRGSTEVPTDELPEPDSSPDPAIGVVDRDELQRALCELSPHQRTVLVLRHIEGLHDQAIAEMLGCSIGTVRSHATRGKARVRAFLSTPHPGPAVASTNTLPKEIP
jgi:RNA polymerase sigma-70 factor (sigma-E family)